MTAALQLLNLDKAWLRDAISVSRIWRDISYTYGNDFPIAVVFWR